MISEASMADVYTDFQGLMQLKTEAGKQTPQALRETARQFEALFVQTMLKAMREASPGGGMGDSNQTEFYRDMYDKQMALQMVKGRGLGIARMLVSSLGSERSEAEPMSGGDTDNPGVTAAPAPVVNTGSVRPLLGSRATGPIVSLESTTPVQALVRVSDRAVMTGPERKAGDAGWHPASPEEFIRDLLPYARKGAADLGVKPAVLIAQAALETGWGQKVIHHADGRSSYNLFGIKAGSGWDGDKVTIATLEYENGVAAKRRAAFRSYDSLEGAVSGYVEFLQNNPRYRSALEQADDPQAYLNGLKAAGYATDPEYAGKIMSIMNQESFVTNVGQLALSQTSVWE